MKIIDKTPLLNEKGELSFSQRLKGMMEYGYNWPSELQAQKAIVNYFDRQLEKGYTLIRNLTLGKSGITVPIILLGPTGIHVIHLAYLKGRYEARGEEWNVSSGDGYKPAQDNLIHQTLRMAKAVRAFIERQGVKVPVEIEPVLIGADPGLHVESVKPAVRVLMIDGVKSYVANLLTAQPVLRPESVYEFSERLINPAPVRKASTSAAASPQPEAAQVDQVVARAQAIFKASEETKPINPADFDFAMVDDDLAFAVSPPTTSPSAPGPVETVPAPKPRRKRILGMEIWQLVILGVLACALACIAASFAYYFIAVA
jgi:nuclease-like protein